MQQHYRWRRYTGVLYDEFKIASSLEGLPAEIRRQIISVFDLYCLKALICASPVFHQQYLLDRRLLLANSIVNTLGSVCIDAHAVLTSQSEACKTVDHSNELLQSWRINVQQKASRNFQLADAVTEDEAVSMASFYFRTIVPIGNRFACSALGKLKIGKVDFNEHAPSITEWQRLVRAIYRFQLLCHVAYPPSSRATVPENARYVFHMMELWEVDELYTLINLPKTSTTRYLTDYKMTCTQTTRDLPIRSVRLHQKALSNLITHVSCC